jgi:hypothetical protein
VEAAILLARGQFLHPTSSVCQRLGARPGPRFDIYLLFRLARQPIWVSAWPAIFGFILQIKCPALRRAGPGPAIWRWADLRVRLHGGDRLARGEAARLASASPCSGLGLFLLAASPSGVLHAPGYLWWLVGLASLGVVLGALAIAFSRPPSGAAPRAGPPCSARPPVWPGLRRRGDREPARTWATASGHRQLVAVRLDQGGATALLSSHALAAGPLAASSPGSPSSTRCRPACSGCSCSASTPDQIAGPGRSRALALALIVGGVSALSHSHLIVGGDDLPVRTSRSRPAFIVPRSR